VFGFGPATRIYVAAGATDLRKNFNGLYGLVQDHLNCDPESGGGRCLTASIFNQTPDLVQ
jgi:IS66 Orf2 like protein